jgi:hypothetical protein
MPIECPERNRMGRSCKCTYLPTEKQKYSSKQADKMPKEEYHTFRVKADATPK